MNDAGSARTAGGEAIPDRMCTRSVAPMKILEIDIFLMRGAARCG